VDASIARRMWLVGEPLHAVTYFAAASFAAWEAAGIRGFWRGYFATRAAPVGAVGPEVVTASFFNFAPTMVARALPSVWGLVTPEAALTARADGAATALQAILGDDGDTAAVSGAAGAVRQSLAGCTLEGRALFAANVALPWPDTPWAALWHGLTLLREHRGDGHNAALVAAGLDGLEAHLLAGALEAGGASPTTRLEARGWTDDDVEAAWARLRTRGLVDADHTATAGGRAHHADVESRTDDAAMAPWRHLGEGATLELEATLRPWAELVGRSGVVRFPNPIGVPPLGQE
jgi:hypothetical protein